MEEIFNNSHRRYIPISVLMKNEEMIAGVVPKQPNMVIIEDVTIVVSANNNYGTINVSDINLNTTGLKMLSVYNKNSGNPLNCSLNFSKTVFKKVEEAQQDISGIENPEFTEAATRANINSKESLPTLFGKIKKFFSDLKAVAFSGSYNDLSDTPTIPAAQIQSDWNQTTTTAKDYIKNKPTIPTVNNATLTIQKNGTTVKTFTANASSNVTANITVPDAQVNSDWKATSGVAQILNKPTLATVATSGSYNDLSNKPTITMVRRSKLII